jgi:long-chain fatty acid transport protein
VRFQADGTILRVLLAGSALSLTLAAQAHAAGFYLEDQSAKASGRAFSGEASDMGAASLWWNPAAIAGIDHNEIYTGATGIVVNSKISDLGSTITHPGQPRGAVGGSGRDNNPVEPGVLPSMGGAYRINDQWSVGLAVTSPFSFATKYDSDSFARYAGLTTRLTTIDLQPTIAWRPNKWIGFGAGPNIEYSNAVFSAALPQLAAGLPDGSNYLHGNGWNVGYNLGVQIHPSDTVTVGLAYRSKIDHSISGNVAIAGLLGPLAANNASFPAQGKFTTPWSATFGVRWKVTDKLAIEGQGVRFGWSEFQQIALSPSPPLAPTSENYHDTTSGAVGLDYDVTPRWTVRAGVQYDPTPTPDIGRDVRVPDGDRYLFAVGTSYKFRRWLTVDAAVSYIDFQKSRINRDATAYAGTAAVTPISVLGEVEASAVTMSLGSHISF